MTPVLKYYLNILLLANVTVGCAQQPTVVPGGGYGLWTVDISSDDKYIALGGDDSLLQVLYTDLSPYKNFKQQQRGMIRSVNWHPENNLLAIATLKDAWMINMESGEEIKLEGVTTGSRSIRWNSTGELLGMADGAGVMLIWNEQGKLLRKIQKANSDQTADKKSFLGFDWHPSNNTFVTIGDEIRVFDTSGRQLNIFTHRKEMAGILSVRWHPSGDFFTVGDYGHEREGVPTLLQFWKPDGTLIREIKDSHSEYRSMSWNKEGTRLATGSDAVRIRNREGEVLFTGNDKGHGVWGVDWTSNSEKIVTVCFATGKIYVWSDKGKLIRATQ